MVDVLVDPTMDPVLSSRLTNFVNKLKTDDAFASFYSWIGNANSKGKDIWVTSDQPAGGYSLPAAWYDDARTITPYGNGRYDWQSATGYATQAEARGISVVFLGHWATAPVNGWPAYNTSVGTADGIGEASVERMVFHELAHGVTKADNFVETLSDGFAGNYNEEIAAALENVFYVPYAHKNGLSDDFMAKGHAYPTANGAILGGVLGVQYLLIGGPDVPPELQVNPFTNAVQIEAEGDNGGGDYGSVIKTYHASNHVELGQAYSRYITIEYSSFDGVFKRDSASAVSFDSILGTKIVPDAIVVDVAHAKSDVVKGLDPMAMVKAMFVEGLNTGSVGRNVVLDGANLDHLISPYVDYELFDRAVLIGADRHYDMFRKEVPGSAALTKYVDVSGVTKDGSTGSPDVIAIDDSSVDGFWFDEETGKYEQDSYDLKFTSSIIFGAGGVDHRKTATDPTNLANNVNTTGASDLIQGGEGRDMIIAGNHDAIRPNTLKGGGGADILVAGTSKDVLHGEAGSDVFVVSDAIGGTGSGQIIGGYGFDIVSFLTTGPVTFNANGTASVGAGASLMSYTTSSVEMVIGSKGSDVLSGGSSSSGSFYMLGGGGDDTFNLSSGAIAAGGDGSDTFKITGVGLSNARYLLIGFGENDKLFLNGTQHHGSQVSVTGIGPSATGFNDLSLSFTSGGAANPFGSTYLESQRLSSPPEWMETFFQSGEVSLIRIEHGDASGTFTTDIYMTDFVNGTGGLNFTDPNVTRGAPWYPSYAFDVQDGASAEMPIGPESVGSLFQNNQLTYDMWF